MKIKLSYTGFAAPLILVVVGLIIGIVGAVSFSQLKPNPSLTPTQESRILQTSTPTPSPTDETVYTEDARSANWKVFISSLAKFLIKYPPGWNELHQRQDSLIPGVTIETVHFGPGITNMSEDPNTKLRILVMKTDDKTPEKRNAESWANTFVQRLGEPYFMNAKIEPATLGALPAYKVSYINKNNNSKTTLIIADHNGLIFDIFAEELRLSEPLRTQILSTFQFTN